jgi:hypothetical protein
VAADAALSLDRGARPRPALGHRLESPETPHRISDPGRGATRTGRRDGLAGRALAALAPRPDAVRGWDGAGAGPRVAGMRRHAPSDAGARDGAGQAVPGDATNARAAAAAHPSLTAPWHQGGVIPAPFPDPFGAHSAPVGAAATASLSAAGGHVPHASSQAAATRRPVARPEPELPGDPVPDDSPVELREPPDLADLADHLNRILRDEARRHGIDV